MLSELIIFFMSAALSNVYASSKSSRNESLANATSQLNGTSANVVTPLPNSSAIDLFELLDNTSAINKSISGESLNRCNPFINGSCNQHLFEVCRLLNDSYHCDCPENVSRTEDGKCLAFNECLDQSYHNCSFYADCIDLPLGYTCACKPGYRDAAEMERILPGRACISLHWVINDSALNIKVKQRINIKNGDKAKSSLKTHEDKKISASFNQKLVPAKIEPSLFLLNASFTDKFEADFSTDKMISENATVNATLITAVASVTAKPSINASAKPTDKLITTDKQSEQHGASDFSTAFPRGTLKEAFQEFDADGNGLISFFELKKAVEKFHVGLDDNEITDMIKVADASGEGLVDFNEFVTLLQKSS